MKQAIGSCLISILLVALLLAPVPSFSAAPVVNGQDLTRNSDQNRLIAELVMQIQQLQNEVRNLRGQLEEQDYRLNQMSKQQRELYLEVERRMQVADQSFAETIDNELTSNQSVDTGSDATTAGSLEQPSAEVQTAYNQAFELMKARDNPAAKLAFQEFLQLNPNTSLSSNAYYWLGQLHYLEKDYVSAEQHFTAVFEQFPGAGKSDVAMYKLGLIKLQTGDKASAKAVFEKLATDFPSSKAGQLAKSKLATL